jgi:hypothetical protein
VEKCYEVILLLKVAFGKQTIGRRRVFMLVLEFRSGVTSAEDADVNGRAKRMRMWI